MRKIGMFITSVLTALTLVGVGIGVGQNLVGNNETTVHEVATPPTLSGSEKFGVYFEHTGGTVAGSQTSFDVYVSDPNNLEIESITSFFFTSLKLDDLEFTPDPSLGSIIVHSCENTTTKIKDGLYFHRVYIAVDTMTPGYKYFSSGKFGNLSFTIPSDASGDNTFKLNNVSISDKAGNTSSSTKGLINVSKASTSLTIGTSGEGGTSSESGSNSSLNSQNSTSGNSTNEGSTSINNSSSEIGGGTSSDVFDESNVSEAFALYSVAPSLFPKGSTTSIDIYAYDKDDLGINSVVFFFAISTQVNNITLVPNEALGDKISYSCSSSPVSTSGGYHYYRVNIAADTMDKDYIPIPEGNIGTIFFEIPVENTVPVSIKFTNAKIVDETNGDTYQKTAVNLNYSEHSNIPLVESSSDTSIKKLTVDGTEVTSSDTTYSTTTTDSTKSTASVAVTLNDSTAKIKSFTVGGNNLSPTSEKYNVSLGVPGSKVTATIVVEAQDGSTKTYTLDIIRKKSSNNLLSSLTIDKEGTTVVPKLFNSAGTSEVSFSGSTKEYTLKISEGTTSLKLTPVLADTYALMKINGTNATSGSTFTVTNLNNNITIEVTAQDSTITTYTLKIVKLSDDTSVSSITTSDNSSANIPLTQSGTAYTSTSNVDYTVSSFKVTVVTNNANAKVTYSANQTFTFSQKSEQTGTVTITVTSESGLTKTYTVSVTRNAANSNVNFAIVVKGKDDNKEYTPITSSETAVSYELPITAGKAIITVVGNAETTTITGTGEFTIPYNGTITATAQSGLKKSITIIITNGADTNNDIDNIRVLNMAGGTEVLGTDGNKVTFNPSTLSYTLLVPYSVENLYFEVTLHSSFASVPEGNKMNTISVGENVFKICAISQASVKGKEYTITVKRAKPDTNCNVSSITVNGTTITTFTENSNGDFEATQKVYVDRSTTTANISLTFADDSTSAIVVTGTGTSKTLNYGTNTLSIIVEAQDKTRRTYYFDIVKGDRVNTIDSITLSSPSDSSYVFSDFSFDPSIYEYTISVPYTVRNIKIQAVATSGYATVSGTILSDPLTQGAECEYTIYATSESKEKGKEYKIKITRALPQTGNTLTSITVGGQSIDMSTFTGTTNLLSSEAIYIDRETDEVDVEVVLASDSSLASVSGQVGKNQPITFGKNEFMIKVTAQSSDPKDYKFFVYRGERNNSITNINIAEIGEFHFDPSKTVYPSETTEYQVAYSINSVSIDVTTNALHGTIKGIDTTSGGVVSLPSGSVKIIRIFVESEIGVAGQEYIIRIRRESSTEADPPKISNITVIGSDTKSYYTFNELDISEKSIAVPYTVASVNVTVSMPAGSANIAVGGKNYNLTPGVETIIRCYVKLPDGSDRTQEYVIKVTRALPSSDNTLSDIKVDGVSIDGFNSEIDEYNVYKPHGATSLVLSATTSDSTSSVSITGGNWTISLTSIKKEVSIIVMAQDGSSKSYKVNIYTGERENEITNIIIDDISEELFSFDKDITTYGTFSIPYSMSQLDITATAKGSFSQVVIENNINLKVGSNSIKVYAINEIGEKGQVYTINVNRKAADTEIKLSSLLVNGTNVDGFNENLLSYTIYVPHGTGSVTFTAVPKSNTTVVTSGNGYRKIEKGKNQHTIVVTAESGTTQSYQITIFCGERKNTIEHIAISNLEVGQFTFVKGQLTYPSITVPYKTKYVDIVVSYDGIFGTVTGEGTRNLSEGSNIITIYVTSEIGDKGEQYEIEIIREAVDTNCDLYNLEVLENGLNKITSFDPSVTTYVIQLADTTTQIVISAVLPANSKATLSGDIGTINLSDYTGKIESGNVIVFTVTVTAENGVKKDYKIRVSRDNVNFDDDNTISGITIVGSDGKTYFDKEFIPLTQNYSFEVPYNVLSISVSVNATARNITGQGTYVFDSKNLIEVIVYATSDNGIKGIEYHLTITREVADDSTMLDSISINGELIDGFSSMKYSYSIKFPNSSTSINLYYQIASDSSTVETIVNGVNFADMNKFDFDLLEGENVISITVYAQSGAYKTYILYVIRQSNRPFLKMLNIENYSLLNEHGQTVAFDKDVFVYYVKVPFEVTSVSVTAETYDPSVSWILYYNGSKKLEVGSNNMYEILVLPDDRELGRTTYTIYITRKTRNTDSINVDGISILNAPNVNFEFKVDEFNYSIVVPSNITSLDLDISFNVSKDETAPVYTVIGNDYLHFGKNSVVVVATASNGINKVIYVIQVERENVSLKNPSIKQIKSFGNDYQDDIESYFYQVDATVSSLDISFDTDNEYTKFVVSENAKNLKKGNNRITVDVYSNDELAKQIVLNVNRGSGVSTVFDVPKGGLIAIFASSSLLSLIGVVVTYIAVRTFKKKRG